MLAQSFGSVADHMPNIHQVTEVFTPNDVPRLTYVYRSEHDFESQLRLALKTPGQIISLSGPSKSGKTALTKTVISSANLILVSGASISSADDLWARVLGWMDVGIEISSRSGSSTAVEISGKAGGSAGVPLVAKGSVEAAAKAGKTDTQEMTTKVVRNSLDQVVKEIANSDFIVFIDDFHYMSADVRASVARQIKEVAEKGVKVLTASVPHRSDDVVRGNPELRGRVRAIDFSYWSDVEIREIANLGFEALNVSLDKSTIDRIVDEAFGSPQLMQSMCLQLCFQLEIEKTSGERAVYSVEEPKIKKVLESTSTTTDFSSALEAMHPGPKLRGQERKQFIFTDGTTGDVYRCVLLAVAQDPPRLSMRYDEILDRVRRICVGDSPVGSAVSQALVQLCGLAETSSGLRFIEWDEDVLDVSDPYFLFYLRCSPQLSKLKSPGVR